MDFNSNRNSVDPQKELISSKKFREKNKGKKFVFAFAFAQCELDLNLMNWLYVVRMNGLDTKILTYFTISVTNSGNFLRLGSI